ncbi:calcium/sodium antiporter [Candidatus Uhrbacteria bacterium]|jgi:cation:H+ antiporter|nr:calcium/sodium antiporter [Candidatus Uhrbacteria bacterium]
MLIPTLILIAGLIVLITSADQLVKGASSIASKFGFSSLMIGLTVVAFGSSAPELVVNIFASLKGSYDVALGNVMGSNIANILLILGIAAMIRPLRVKRATIFREIPFAILGMLVLIAMVSDKFLAGDSGIQDVLSRGDGIALIGFFSIFLYSTFLTARHGRSENLAKAKKAKKNGEGVKEYKTWLAVVMVLGGLIGLTVGGQLIVESAIAIAKGFGVSEALIAVTIVAIGTSLPELAASGVAAYRGDTDLAVGNIVGSNIFNVFWILGLSSTINPLPISEGASVDIIIALAATFMLFPFLFNRSARGKAGLLERWEGAASVFAYCLFIAFAIWRG